MPRYKNGQVPTDVLVKIASGTNTDGYWEHLLPPATLLKHNALVALGQKASGRTLQITPGYNAYRPLAAQTLAKKNAIAAGRPGDAAAPGTSSHGLTFRGAITGNVEADSAAMDYGNWQYVFGTYAAFAAACTAVGLIPGVFSWEQWHVIDLDPWAAISASTSSTPFPIEELDMTDMILVHHESADWRNGTVLAAAGHWHPFSGEEWQYASSKTRTDGKPIFDGVPIVNTDGNPRAYDLLRNMYSPVVQATTLADADLAKLVEQIAAKLPTITGATPDQVQQLLVNALGGLTLKAS
ncbi:MAG: hypothetical protein J0H96_05635 [Microbacterium ginsengisoli]|nr:hypothetical protein [Microbacterium ginsengisoli]